MSTKPNFDGSRERLAQVKLRLEKFEKTRDTNTRENWIRAVRHSQKDVAGLLAWFEAGAKRPQTAADSMPPAEPAPPEDIALAHGGVFDVSVQFICPKCRKADSSKQDDMCFDFEVSCRYCDYKYKGKLKVTLT